MSGKNARLRLMLGPVLQVVDFPDRLVETTAENTTVDRQRAEEQRADDALSDFGSDAMRRRWSRFSDGDY